MTDPDQRTHEAHLTIELCRESGRVITVSITSGRGDWVHGNRVGFSPDGYAATGSTVEEARDILRCGLPWLAEFVMSKPGAPLHRALVDLANTGDSTRVYYGDGR